MATNIPINLQLGKCSVRPSAFRFHRIYAIRVCIKSRMNPNSDKIEQLTSKLPALDYQKFNCKFYVNLAVISMTDEMFCKLLLGWGWVQITC